MPHVANSPKPTKQAVGVNFRSGGMEAEGNGRHHHRRAGCPLANQRFRRLAAGRLLWKAGVWALPCITFIAMAGMGLCGVLRAADEPTEGQPPAPASRAETTTADQNRAFAGPSLPADDPDVRVLKEQGIQADAESLRGFLQLMIPDDNARKAQAALIQQLGHPAYQKREQAMRTLLQIPSVDVELLKRAAGSDDLEVRWRAGRLLQQSRRRNSAVLHAVYSVIRRGEIKGVVPEVLSTMPLCDDDRLLNAASGALSASAREEDAALLKQRLHDEWLPLRRAAIAAYGRAVGSRADEELKKLLNDPNDLVKLAAARSLLEHGNRAALPVLGELLDSEELRVRVRSVKLLRQVSGRRFRFVAYESPETRAAALRNWREWIAAEGQAAELKLPLKTAPYEVGRILICDYSRNRILELDLKGRTLWERPVGKRPWGCQGLPNGNRLVASYATRTVTEYSAEGKTVWAKAALPGGPTSVERLENGHTLVACTDSQKIIELNRKGDIVWSVTISQRPTDARRLDNGRTLICLQSGGRVVEVDHKERVRWEIQGLRSPFSAQRLDNGHTLVACTGDGSVREYDRNGTLVWQKHGFSSAYDAQRLNNGHTLISDYRGLREIDADGKVLWMKSLKGISKFHRY